MPSIETDVKGSPGTCRETAAWLGTLADAAHQAGDAVRAACGEASATWHGPASDAFHDAVNGVPKDCDTLGDQATNMARALNDFAGAIDSVASQMAQARQVAQSGGLTVSGTVILPPKQPGVPPNAMTVCTATHPAGAVVMVGQNAAAAQAYQQAVNAYNTQVGVFNQAKGMVDHARGVEQAAHAALEKAMHDGEGESSNLKTIGVTVTQRVLDAIKGSNEGAEGLRERADEFRDAANTYQQFAEGHAELLTPQETALLDRLGKESDQLASINEAKATQLEQWMKVVPQNARQLIAANPGTLLTDASMYGKYLKPFLKNMPYVGSVFTIASEGWDVMDGEKTPGQAIVDGGSDIVGSAAGGAAGEAAGEAAGGWLGGMLSGAELGAEAGTVEPGLGNVVGAVVGGVAGGFVGGEAMKGIVHSMSNAANSQQQSPGNEWGSPAFQYPG